MDTEGGSTSSEMQTTSVPVFGARKKAKELAAQVNELREQLDRLGGLTVLELESKRDALQVEITHQREQLETEKSEATRAVEEQAAEASAALSAQLAAATEEKAALEENVVTEEVALLQEAGVYEYNHPLEDSVEYQDALKGIREQIKAMTKRDGGAVKGSTQWRVNGSLPQGRKMVRDFSKLLLRAYNAEADNLVRGLKPYKLDSAVDRLNKVVNTIQNLGKTMSIQVTPDYHRLRIRELELAADYQEMLAREKDKEREERERLREQRKVEQEIAREKERLEKERQHYANAIQALLDKGDTEGAERMRAQ